MLIKNIELTPSGVKKFNEFFAVEAKPGVNMQAVTFEMLRVLEDRAGMEESLCYELRGPYTNSGNPEIFRVDVDDVAITLEDDSE